MTRCYTAEHSRGVEWHMNYAETRAKYTTEIDRKINTRGYQSLKLLSLRFMLLKLVQSIESRPSLRSLA